MAEFCCFALAFLISQACGVQRHSFHQRWRAGSSRSADGGKSFTQLNHILKWWQSYIGQAMDLRLPGTMNHQQRRWLAAAHQGQCGCRAWMAKRSLSLHEKKSISRY